MLSGWRLGRAAVLRNADAESGSDTQGIQLSKSEDNLRQPMILIKTRLDRTCASKVTMVLSAKCTS